MIFVVGSNSYVIKDFVQKHRSVVFGVSRRPSEDTDIIWDLSVDSLPEILLNKIREDKEPVIVYAAAYKPEKFLISHSDDEINDSFAVNYFSYLKLLRSVLPSMISKKNGRIIYLASSYAEKNSFGSSIYGSSKAAGVHLTRTVAKEYARFNIHANSVMLGFFDGPLWQSIPEVHRNDMIKMLPSKKMGKGKNLSALLEYLVASDCYVNGQNIYLDGGL
jgi:3-oxoacyl-[acyl-carrier protein] reductase